MVGRREFYKIGNISEVQRLGCSQDIDIIENNDGIYKMVFDVGTYVGEVRVNLSSMKGLYRAQLKYKGSLVADSAFVSNSLPAPYLEDELVLLTELNEYTYNPTNLQFQLSNSNVPVNYNSSVMSVSTETRVNGSGSNQTGVVPNYPSPTALASLGVVSLKAMKTDANETEMELIVAKAVIQDTVQIETFMCPFGEHYLTELPLRGDCNLSTIDSTNQIYLVDGFVEGGRAFTDEALTEFNLPNTGEEWGVSIINTGTPSNRITFDEDGIIQTITAC